MNSGEKTGRKPFIGVIGAGHCSQQEMEQAYAVGCAIARQAGILVCGGLGGTMEASARGAKESGGITIGIIPGDDKSGANTYIDYPIATGFGEARNLVIIKTSDAVIALPGKYGTLSEMAFCMKVGKPLVSLSNWEISDDITRADNPEEAVKLAFQLAGR